MRGREQEHDHGGRRRAALADFTARNAPAGHPAPVVARNAKTPDGWWQEAFKDRLPPSEQRGHACGEKEMLMIVAYDIADHRRLAQVAKHCEDHGVRVQYSVFECRLPAAQFEQFWRELRDLIEPNEDRIVAYRVCAECAREILAAGTMVLSSEQKVVAYVV